MTRCASSFEVAHDVGDDRADREHIEIDEHHVVAGVEVFVTDVAPTDDRHLTVRGERLVVHPPVEAREIRDVIHPPPPTVCERIEQPHLDVRVPIQRRENRVETESVVVVEQQANAHATVGGATQCVEQQATG